jgi:hypothetical protein
MMSRHGVSAIRIPFEGALAIKIASGDTIFLYLFFYLFLLVTYYEEHLVEDCVQMLLIIGQR